MCWCRLDHYLGGSAINLNILQFKYVQDGVEWWMTKYRCNKEIKLGPRITQTQFPYHLQFSVRPPLTGRRIWFRQIQVFLIEIKCKCFCRQFLFWHLSSWHSNEKTHVFICKSNVFYPGMFKQEQRWHLQMHFVCCIIYKLITTFYLLLEWVGLWHTL